MLKMNALCLGALVIMATLLGSSQGQRYPGLSKCIVYIYIPPATLVVCHAFLMHKYMSSNVKLNDQD